MTVSIGNGLPLRVEDLPEDPDGPRMELIDGGLHVTPLPKVSHQGLIMSLSCDLMNLAPAAWRVLPGANVLRRGTTDRLLIPDVVVVAESAYAQDLLYVDPSDVLLVVEVESPSTRSMDRFLKRELYAQWRIPHYWIIDPVDRTVTRLALTAGETPDRYGVVTSGAGWLAAYDEGGLWQPRGGGSAPAQVTDGSEEGTS